MLRRHSQNTSIHSDRNEQVDRVAGETGSDAALCKPADEDTTLLHGDSAIFATRVPLRLC